ncbi:hypothetical protein SRABI128_05562 [Microbacterium sp. Bi128]|nr:hypothetical protein SRABI128_05562 [Microbacterium sp. Bi128]
MMVHCSTSNGWGLPNSLVNPDFSTSAHVTPLTVHCPWSRKNFSSRFALAIAGVRLMVGMPPLEALTEPPSSRVAGMLEMEPAPDPESATTWKRMILLVFAKSMLFLLLRFRSSINWPVRYFRKSISTS